MIPMTRSRVCIFVASYPVVGGMARIVSALGHALSGEREVLIVGRKFGPSPFNHYQLSPPPRSLFGPWHLLTTPFYVLTAALWTVLLKLGGVETILAQDASFTACGVALGSLLVRSSLIVFDYGLLVNNRKSNPRYLKIMANQFQRGRMLEAWSRMLRLMSRVALLRTTRFFSYSDELTAAALEHGLHPDKVVKYAFPVDTNSFKPLGRHELRHQGPFRLLYVGRLSGDKGFPVLLRAIERLRNLDLRLTVIGEGDMMEWLLDMKRSRSWIDVLGPVSDGEKLNEIMNSCDLFVYPILISGGYAMAFLEAMASGLPGVITDVGPTCSLLLGNPALGLVAKAGDERSLSESIERLLRNRSLWQRISQNAPRFIQARFGTESFRHTIQKYLN